jgi:tetratricopeptide (TPR) repeat protein
MDIVFDTERIRTFLAKLEGELEEFCNFQKLRIEQYQHRHRPDLAYDNFHGDVPLKKVGSIVKVHFDKNEIPYLLFYLAAWWLDYDHNESAIIETGMSNDLCLASQILWERDRVLGEQAFDYLARIDPAFKEIWKPENVTKVIFNPLRNLDEFLVHLSHCENLLQQVNGDIQQHHWKDAWGFFSQLQSLQPNYGNFSWKADQERDFVRLQKLWDAASSGFVYEETLPQGKMFPYVLFHEMKKAITPASSMNEVQAELRELTGLSAATRTALESLGKNEEDRLSVDVFLYPNCPSIDMALSIEQTFLKTGCLPTPDEIKSQFPSVAGELLILLGYLEEAAAFWQAAQRESPLNGKYAHNLGLLYLGLCQTPNEMAVYNWQCAIAQWAIALSDTTYWVSWGRERFKAYGRSFIFGTVSKFTSGMTAILSEFIEHSPLSGESSEKAQEIAALQRDRLVEFTAVHLMQAIGNIPLVSGRLARFGPLWMEHFGAEVNARGAVSQFMWDVRPVDIQPNALMEGLTTEDVLQRLRWLFSELSLATSQLDSDPRAALESLSKRSAVPSWENNPAYELLPNNTLRLTEDAIQLEFHARLYLLAKLLAQPASVGMETFQKEWQGISELMGRSTEQESFRVKLWKFLEEASTPFPSQSQPSVERLNTTIALLETYPMLADEPPVKNRLAVWLRGRAMYRQEQGDTPGAEVDLKRSLDYNPNDWESRALLANLWITLIIGISDQFLALDYLRRARELILEGKARNPGFDFGNLLQEIENGIKRFTNPEPGHAIFRSGQEENSQMEYEPPSSVSEGQESTADEESPSETLKMYRQAMQEKLSGRPIKALRTLGEALRMNQNDADLQSLATEIVTALAAHHVDQKKPAEAKKLIIEWMPRLPLYRERLERRRAFLGVWHKLKVWLGDLPYHISEYEFLEVPIQSRKTSTLMIKVRPEKDDLLLSVSLPIIPISDEETVLTNLLQATRLSPIIKVACPKKFDFLLMGQAPVEMLDAKWFLLLILELFHYADVTHPELLELDGLQNQFRENHQQLTQDFKTQEFLSASSTSVERYCAEHSLGFVRTTEARFEIGAFSPVIMDASKDNVRFSTVLSEIDVNQSSDRLTSLRKCAELNHSLQWCKLTLNEAGQIVLSLELPYVEGELTDQAFSQLEKTWREVKEDLAGARQGQA